MKAKRRTLASLGVCFALGIGSLIPVATAEQPVMGMVPRWDGGYGLQTFWFYRDSDTLLDGDSETANTEGAWSRESKTSIEGVYTWDRSIRFTFKMPYLERDRLSEVDGTMKRQSASGWGDLKLALPLKKYFNKEGYSGNYSLTPQVKLPTGDEDADIALGDGEFDFGLSLSYEKENPYLLYNYGVTYWKTGSESKSDRWELDSLIAWNFSTDKFIGLDIHGEWENASRSERIELGPSFYWWIDKKALMKIGYKAIVHERLDGRGLSYGDEFRIGFGFVR